MPRRRVLSVSAAGWVAVWARLGGAGEPRGSAGTSDQGFLQAAPPQPQSPVPQRPLLLPQVAQHFGVRVPVHARGAKGWGRALDLGALAWSGSAALPLLGTDPQTEATSRAGRG